MRFHIPLLGEDVIKGRQRWPSVESRRHQEAKEKRKGGKKPHTTPTRTPKLLPSQPGLCLFLLGSFPHNTRETWFMSQGETGLQRPSNSETCSFSLGCFLSGPPGFPTLGVHYSFVIFFQTIGRSHLVYPPQARAQSLSTSPHIRIP